MNPVRVVGEASFRGVSPALVIPPRGVGRARTGRAPRKRHSVLARDVEGLGRLAWPWRSMWAGRHSPVASISSGPGSVPVSATGVHLCSRR